MENIKFNDLTQEQQQAVYDAYIDLALEHLQGGARNLLLSYLGEDEGLGQHLYETFDRQNPVINFSTFKECFEEEAISLAHEVNEEFEGQKDY